MTTLREVLSAYPERIYMYMGKYWLAKDILFKCQNWILDAPVYNIDRSYYIPGGEGEPLIYTSIKAIDYRDE